MTKTHSKACSLGYPYLTGDGRKAADGETWLTECCDTNRGDGETVWVGWSTSTKEWVVEHGDPR